MFNSNILGLIKGYKKFRERYLENPTLPQEFVEKGQSPQTMVISCCDSRVDPALITSSDLGELFVVRNIANLVPPFSSYNSMPETCAALEYGVTALQVRDLIIVGHNNCGGIRALMASQAEEGAINSWITLANKAKETVQSRHPNATFEEQCSLCEKESLILSYRNLQTFPFIKERVKKGDLSFHAWFYHIEDGSIEGYDESTAQYFPL